MFNIFKRKKKQKEPETINLTACPISMCASSPLGTKGCGVCIGPPENAPLGYLVSERGYIIVKNTPKDIHEAVNALIDQRRKEINADKNTHRS